MKLGRRQMLFVGFMLFSLIFGAGNLIFPPFLGQNAGTSMPAALAGFLITAVVLPVLGVVAISQSDGLDHLSGRVGKRFSLVFTVLIYLSIGPGLAIPRAASVPYEMVIAPYLPEGANHTLWMIAYSLIFFVCSAWLALNPGKLIDRLGSILTPILLGLMLLLFASFLLRGEKSTAAAQTAYAAQPFLRGFTEGYLTMDTIAALNFGLVISTTLKGEGVTDRRRIVRYTVSIGSIAGAILALVYVMLSHMGAASSGVYPIQDNGAWTLRCIVAQLYGEPGAVLLAAIFTLACLTTCVGLIASVAQYFADLLHGSYRLLVVVITAFSFVVCNQGLTAILSVSVPILSAIYPVAIVLILMGLTHRLHGANRSLYPMVVWPVAAVSVLDAAGLAKPVLARLPLQRFGFGWVSLALFMAVLSGLCWALKRRCS